jgi:TolA-binding protein
MTMIHAVHHSEAGREPKLLARLLLIVLLVPLVLSTGCSLFGPKYVIPPRNSAREQAQTADLQYRVAQNTIDPKTRVVEMKKAAAAFEEVAKRFPNDRVYTPASLLMVGDIYYQIQDFRRAEMAHRRTLAKYPDIPEIRAGALQGLGESLIELKRYTEGNEKLQTLVDEFGQSEDPTIRPRLARARTALQRVR